MSETPAFCLGCPSKSPFREGAVLTAVASDCGGRWRIMRGAVVMTISGEKEVRPTADLEMICGRDMKGKTLEPEDSERIITSRTSTGMDVLIVNGPEAAGLARNTPKQDTDLLNLARREQDRSFQATPIPAGVSPAELTVIHGGGDVSYIKRMIGSIVGDAFLGRLTDAIGAVEHARLVTTEGIADSSSPLALGALAAMERVEVALRGAIGNEEQLRHEGLAYVGDLG